MMIQFVHHESLYSLWMEITRSTGYLQLGKTDDLQFKEQRSLMSWTVLNRMLLFCDWRKYRLLQVGGARARWARARRPPCARSTRRRAASPPRRRRRTTTTPARWALRVPTSPSTYESRTSDPNGSKMKTATWSCRRRHRIRRIRRTLRTRRTQRYYSSVGDYRWRYRPPSAATRSYRPRQRRSSPPELREPPPCPRTPAPPGHATATPAPTAAKRSLAARTSRDIYGRTRGSNLTVVNTASDPSRYHRICSGTWGISTTRRGRSGVVTATAVSGSRRI